METIRVALDQTMLRAADREAKRVHIREIENCDRQGYQAQPDSSAEFGPWERVEAWPEE
jgi:hypothetical protein